MLPNPVQFAVVREDAEIERALGGDRPPRRVVMVASGGCTALTLQAAWPDTEFTLIDPNAAQLALVRRKVETLAGGLDAAALRAFGVGTDAADSLTQCGNFESLFRGLRRFVEELVAPPEEIEAWFDPGRLPSRVAAALARPYWPVAFELFFSDALLDAMFTPAATQHAPAGSYPGYFRAQIERGLLAARAPDNYFLHHVFLGRYLDRPDALPPFLSVPAARHRFELIQGTFNEVASFSGYDLVDLSNVMDWMSPEASRQLVERLRGEVRPGAVVVWRQLNNSIDRQAWFGDSFVFDRDADAGRAAADRSLFYSSIHVGTRR